MIIIAEKQRVLYSSRLLTVRAVRDLSRKVKALLEAGQEIEANILILRNASKRKKF